MRRPLVSICLPVLNAQPYLEVRIQTILAQTLTDWELIVCDSYSDDGSWELLQAFKADQRIRLHQVSREGIYAGWNECLKRCRGKYIYIATADDTMTPECLDKMVTALVEHPECDIAHCCLTIILGDLIEHKHIRFAPFDALLQMNLTMAYSSVTQLLIRQDVFEKCGLFPCRYGSIGDYGWELLASVYFNTLHIPEYLVTWRYHASQATTQAVTASKVIALHRMLKNAMPHLRAKHPDLYKLILRKKVFDLYAMYVRRLLLLEDKSRYRMLIDWRYYKYAFSSPFRASHQFVCGWNGPSVSELRNEIKHCVGSIIDDQRNRLIGVL